MMDAVALKEHPNPDRIGCPDTGKLESFARNPKSFPLRDLIFEHLAHCSPCLKFVRERRPR